MSVHEHDGIFGDPFETLHHAAPTVGLHRAPPFAGMFGAQESAKEIDPHTPRPARGPAPRPRPQLALL